MATYTLTISLTAAQVSTLRAAGDTIMLAKPSSAGGPPNVAWLTLPPQEHTTVSWTNEYGLYFSTQALAAGVGIISAAAISLVAVVPPPLAQQALYTLSAAGIFTGPDTSQGMSGVYALLNQYENGPAGAATTVGLTQNATVNNTPLSTGPLPILADAVLTGQTDTIAPGPAVYIWTQSAGGSTSRALVVTGGQTCLAFSSSTLAITVGYDEASGTFVAKLT